MTEKLKPCPFCGGEAAVSYSIVKKYFITCLKCYASTKLKDTEGLAIKAWNRRVNDEPTN